MLKKFLTFSISLALFLPLSSNLLAWDSTGHRLSAAVALNFVEMNTRDTLFEILAAHPRYQQDFIDAIPDFIDADNQSQLQQWLLGQAAYWPDIARGLPDAERRRFNRPPWHYTDGAWVRDHAQLQGNVYVDLERFEDIAGMPREDVISEADVSNVTTAIDYNTRVLIDSSRPASDRAIALCWVLHLMGDIHQPLHAGSLFSPVLFDTGDRGGNGIAIGDDTLHGRWDSALAEGGFLAELPLLLDLAAGYRETNAAGAATNWSQWLNESRQLIQSIVYTTAMVRAIRNADANNSSMPAVTLSNDYVGRMEQTSRQRLGLAGLRMANFFNAELTR